MSVKELMHPVVIRCNSWIVKPFFFVKFLGTDLPANTDYLISAVYQNTKSTIQGCQVFAKALGQNIIEILPKNDIFSQWRN